MKENENSSPILSRWFKVSVRWIFGKKSLIMVIPFVITLTCVLLVGHYLSKIKTKKIVYDYSFFKIHLAKYKDNWRNLSKEEIKSLSNLGRILYLNETPPVIQNRTEKYKILMWKEGPDLEERLIYRYGKKIHDPFEDCLATNCILTYKDKDLSTADIVLFHMHSIQSIDDLPPRKNRNKSQIWVFETQESPYHTFPSPEKAKEYNGLFNWTMTYRMDADIPIPYGRAILESSPKDFNLEREFFDWIQHKRKDVLVAIMGSNCEPKNNRWKYVEELKKHIRVDIYGGCGTITCPGHYGSDCKEINRYMFYLAFENSNCKDYITEKLWWYAYHKNSIPIIMGPLSSNLKKLLPYHSYISVRDFDSPKHLAIHLAYIYNTPTELAAYLAWKSSYKIANEHGYFKTKNYYYCRVCEALNFNSKEHKVYNDLEQYWGLQDCYSAWDDK